MEFFSILKERNESLFYFGLICFILVAVFAVLSGVIKVQLFGVNAWNKPIKFALSIGLYVWTIAWYCSYLPQFNIKLFNWTIIVLLGLELFYIAIQAARGQQSHFNVSSPFYNYLYMLMAVAATTVSIYTAYIAYQFFIQPIEGLTEAYLWAIRFGMILFVIFSLEGFAMGARLSHSVGAINDNSNLFLLGWSKTVGDLRVAHFIGMHALQVLPLVSYYFIQNTRATFLIAGLYAVLAITTLVQALMGKSLF